MLTYFPLNVLHSSFLKTHNERFSTLFSQNMESCKYKLSKISKLSISLKTCLVIYADVNRTIFPVW